MAGWLGRRTDRYQASETTTEACILLPSTASRIADACANVSDLDCRPSRRLPVCATQRWRAQLAAACAAHSGVAVLECSAGLDLLVQRRCGRCAGRHQR